MEMEMELEFRENTVRHVNLVLIYANVCTYIHVHMLLYACIGWICIMYCFPGLTSWIWGSAHTLEVLEKICKAREAKSEVSLSGSGCSNLLSHFADPYWLLRMVTPWDVSLCSHESHLWSQVCGVCEW